MILQYSPRETISYSKIIFFLIGPILLQGCLGLKDVKLELPEYALYGREARLKCKYDMEHDALYAIKWYKGPDEFYRYIPKEVPPIQVFPVNGINVNTGQSNDHDVLLTKVSFDSSGIYKCVVSAESPFQTLSDSGNLLVLLIGDDTPFLQLDRFQYHPGDTVTVRCHVPASLPTAPNITWYLNDKIISGGGELVGGGGGQKKKTELLTSSSSSSHSMINDNNINSKRNTISSTNNNSNNISSYYQHNHQSSQSSPAHGGTTTFSESRNSNSNSNRLTSSSTSPDGRRDFSSNSSPPQWLQSLISFHLPGSITPVHIKCRASVFTAYDQNVTIRIVPVPRTSRLGGPDTLFRSSGMSTLDFHQQQQHSAPLSLILLLLLLLLFDDWSSS